LVRNTPSHPEERWASAKMAVFSLGSGGVPSTPPTPFLERSQTFTHPLPTAATSPPPSQGKLAPAKMTCSSRKKVTVGKFPFDVNTRKSRSRMVLQYSFGWEPINKYFGKPLRVRLFSRFSMAPQKLMTALRAGVFFKVDDSPQGLELGGWVRLDLGIPTYFPPPT